MTSLTILSPEASSYRVALEAADLPGLSIACATDDPANVDPASLDLLLADPDLAVDVLPRANNIRWLQSTWAGNEPLIKLEKRDYLLTGAKGIFEQAIREYVTAYVLYFSRRMESFHPRQTSTPMAREARWDPPPVGSLAGKCLAIMGAGDMARALPGVARCFNMSVIGLNRSGRQDTDYDRVFSPATRLEFAAKADYVVSLLPDTPATDHLIDADFLAAMKRDAVLINAGRGNSVDDVALLSALDNGELQAAVLDVFKHEPLPPDHPFWTHSRVWVTQHTAALSDPAAVTTVFIDNYQRLLRAQPLRYLVDFNRGY